MREYLAILTGEREDAHETYKLRRLDNAPKTNYELAFAVTAILGEIRLAFLLTMSELESCYIVCPGCENCDEEIEFGYFDPSKRIEKVDVPAKQWDGVSMEDTSVWLFNLFALLSDTGGVERLRYYFGTYTCPECGQRIAVLTGMAGYFLS